MIFTNIVTIILPAFVTVLYLTTAIAWWIKKDFWTGFLWSCYAFANIGLIMTQHK